MKIGDLALVLKGPLAHKLVTINAIVPEGYFWDGSPVEEILEESYVKQPLYIILGQANFTSDYLEPILTI